MNKQSPTITVGYKLFKELEDSVEIIRIIKVKKYKDGGIPAEVTIRDEGTGEVKKVRTDSLKDYTPLEPDGYLTFNIVNIKDSVGKISKDIIVTASKMLNIKIGDILPFAICRQSITDIFYNLLCSDESQMIAGLAVNQNNCPANFDFRILLACDNIEYSEHVNIYRSDLLEDILDMIRINRFDEVLKDMFLVHAKASKDPSINFKQEDRGWCKNLKTLLKENNFQNDINEMLGITDVDFEISKYTCEKPLFINGEEKGNFTSCTDELRLWLSSIYKINISECTFLEYGHDIDLADFNNARYFLLRDKTHKLYLVVYTCDGEYLESDLDSESQKKDFSSEFRLNFYNKYNHIK